MEIPHTTFTVMVAGSVLCIIVRNPSNNMLPYYCTRMRVLQDCLDETLSCIEEEIRLTSLRIGVVGSVHCI